MLAAGMLLSVSGCSSIVDSMLEDAFGSDRERREKAYRRKGASKGQARRMAFEDEVWESGTGKKTF